MRIIVALLLAVSVFASDKKDVDNPAIDMPGYLRDAAAAAEARKIRRLSEEEFIAMSREPGVVILDARSRDWFESRHITGAVNLPFTDFTAAELARVIPSPETRILIYCNNNFANDERAMATKAAPASLNLSTWTSLYTYGYRNVYELGPRLDVNATKIAMKGTGVR